MAGHRPDAVELGNGVSESDLLVHDEKDDALAFLRLCPKRMFGALT